MHPLIDEYSTRILGEYPDADAVILKGSHARGNASKHSDIDFDVLVSTPDVDDYRTWLASSAGRLVHISAAVQSTDSWLADANEPSPWSLGLPTIETTRLVWARTDALQQRLDHPHRSHPPMAPEVEDSVEALLKIRNAMQRGDDHGVYRNAAKLATLFPTMLVPINPPISVPNSRSAIDAVLAFTNVPPGFAEDWITCMGYLDERTVGETAAAAERLIRGILPMLPHDATIVGNDIARILADGSLWAYLTQDDAP